mmetsp:Transcript_88611/g.246010  ORF Transcript_88611/g.246010 Transcript_88611/m.246010 type:complete len:229 (+) Transcript_88611:155-841(+)
MCTRSPFCGPGDGLFCTAANTVTTTNWTYVGEGNGSYDVLKQYSFVGEGSGSFEKEEVVQHVGCRLRTCTIALLTCLFLAGAAWLLDQLLPRQTNASSAEARVADFDCSSASTRPAHWSSKQKDWCCRKKKTGCEAATPAHATTGRVPTYVGQPFDCNAALRNWRKAWSTKKKNFCCKVHQIGCPEHLKGMSTTSFAFNCTAGYSNWRKGWSTFKKDWCCKHRQRGCQ